MEEKDNSKKRKKNMRDVHVGHSRTHLSKGILLISGLEKGHIMKHRGAMFPRENSL